MDQQYIPPYYISIISCLIYLYICCFRDDSKPKVQYVATATLLEPNNFIPSWEAGDEEKKEVSQTLRKLRIKYDNINKLVRQKERELNELKVIYIYI